MNKLGAPVDNALLAAKLAPRLELVALQQGQVATDAAAGPVVQVRQVVNDVRLPSHLALERQLPAGVSAAPAQADAAAPAAARLSAVARVIGALLAELPDAGPVRAATPMWPSSQPPASTALAASLAQAVDRSGLFYESHLLQFAAGTRTLAQMAQEPQARWAPSSLARGDAAAPAVVAAATATAAASGSLASESLRPNAPLAAMPAPRLPVSADQLPEQAGAPGAVPAAPSASPERGGPAAGMPNAAPPPPEARADAVPSADVQRVRAAYRAGNAASVASFEAVSEPRAETVVMRHGATAAVSAALAVQQPAGELIHPQAATVVHQQLDLLATAVFRWSGQAWPEVPMDWSIQEEGGRPHGEAEQEEAPRRWTTTLSLKLPRLGAVDLRLSLAGPVVQAQFAASEAATAGRLRSHGPALEQRFEAAGLRLEGLRVGERGERGMA